MQFLPGWRDDTECDASETDLFLLEKPVFS